MHPYIPYLIADIEAAHRVEIPYKSSEVSDIENHLEEVERWIAGDVPHHTLGYYCGIKTIDFPPSEQLSKQGIKLVCAAFKKLLFSWNVEIHLPDELPLDLRYRFMIKTLDEKFFPMSSGFIHFDFCTGYAPDCVLKEYCPCLEIWNNTNDMDIS